MSEDGAPVLDPLENKMRCGMFSNAKGDVMIVHGEPLESEIQWVEFNKATGALCLVHEDGKTQDLGIQVDERATNNISNGQEVTLVHFADKIISSHQTIVMIIHDD